MSYPRPIQSPDPDNVTPTRYIPVRCPAEFYYSSPEEPRGQDNANKPCPVPPRELSEILKYQCSRCGASLTLGQELCTGTVRVREHGPLFPAKDVVCGRKKCTTVGCYRRTETGECYICRGDSVAVPLM